MTRHKKSKQLLVSGTYLLPLNLLCKHLNTLITNPPTYCRALKSPSHPQYKRQRTQTSQAKANRKQGTRNRANYTQRPKLASNPFPHNPRLHGVNLHIPHSHTPLLSISLMVTRSLHIPILAKYHRTVFQKSSLGELPTLCRRDSFPTL